MSNIDQKNLNPESEMENNTELQDENYLNDIWMMYFHDPYDTDWTVSSYQKIDTPISSIQDYIQHWLCLENNIEKGMFFLMREHVFPIWDSPENIEGGTLSIKILKDSLKDFWKQLTFNLLGETLIRDEYRDKTHLINGISTSPKKHFCIVKIWLSDCQLSEKKYFNLSETYHGDIIYRSNRDNINNEHTKLSNS